MMRRVFLEEGEYKKHWQSSIFWVESDYMKEYHKASRSNASYC
jgi:hypothetical protein